MMKLWIARSEYGDLKLYTTKPHKELSICTGSIYWNDGNSSYNISDELFLEVTFENSPQEVELKLVEK